MEPCCQQTNKKRVLLKLSGEALINEGHRGINPQALKEIAEEIADAYRCGNCELTIVLGGGNIWRGVRDGGGVIDRVNSDNMGILDSATYDVWHDKILAPASDNFKTAESLVVIQELLKDTTVNPATKIALFEFIDRLLGLQFIDRAQKLRALENETAPAEIVALAESRATAKANKDWATADALRVEIENAGWSVLDGRDGYKIVKRA